MLAMRLPLSDRLSISLTVLPFARAMSARCWRIREVSVGRVGLLDYRSPLVITIQGRGTYAALSRSFRCNRVIDFTKTGRSGIPG